MSSAKYIIILQSVCSLKTLSREGFTKTFGEPVLFLSDGGRPSPSFMSFLQQLTETVVPNATVFGFMDFDPYSICIFKGIKYGFKTQAFRLTFTKCLKMNCLGVDSSDLDCLKKYMMPMDTKCIAKAENLLKEGHLDDYMKKNLQVMIERK